MFSDSQRNGDGSPGGLRTVRVAFCAALLVAIVLALPGLASGGSGVTASQSRASHLIANASRVFSAQHPGLAAAALQCTVPKLTKLTQKQATAKLKKARCGKPKIKKSFSSKIKKGRVIKTSPAAK